jgi:predicted dehydrogenase
MNQLCFAIIGTGFWANYQLNGWLELDGVKCIAVCDISIRKAEEFASKFGIVKVYSNPQTLLDNEDLDFVDICTDVSTHFELTSMAAKKGITIVCQKPMASSLTESKEMVNICRENGVKLFINENFRWQLPIRRLKEIADSGAVGQMFKVRVSFCSAFPVFDNQPSLAELDKFTVTDMGSHIFDIVRFICGEAYSMYCLTKRVNQKIRGEDVANCILKMQNGIHCYVEMSYASILEKESFPQTLLLIEGTHGSTKLEHDYVIKTTNSSGTVSEEVKPKTYKWIDPQYSTVHSSIVEAQRNILQGLRGGTAETSGEDNLKTVELVWAAYASAASSSVQILD